MVADERSKRITDGWHRVRAKKRVHGPGASIQVELRKYKNEAEMVKDAIAMNSSHGRRLDVMDQTRAVLMLERHGVPMEQIALVMHVTEERVGKLRVRVANANTVATDTVPGTRKITLKRSVGHMAGKTLTKEQAEAHDSMPGTSFLLVARQLSMALRTGLINLDDGRLMDELKVLKMELDKLFE